MTAKFTTEALRGDLAAWLNPVPSAAGLHVCALVPDGRIDLDRVIERARGRDVAVESLAGYCAEPSTRRGLVIGYGAIPAERINEGLQRIARSMA
jgi:GntR family transcriptional regulator/MocR family aminotransferase